MRFVNVAFVTLDFATLLYTYISRFSVTPHYQQKRKSRRRCHRNSVPNRFSSRFLTFPTNGPRLLSRVKAGTHSPSGEESHTRAHTAKHGVFWVGALSLPSDRSTRFGNPVWPGVRTANFAAFGSWSEALLKDTESLGTAMCLCASLFRGIAAPLGCAPCCQYAFSLF